MGNSSTTTVACPPQLTLEQELLPLGGDVTVASFARKLASAAAGSVVVVCGAGISVAAGIPDFRTPGTGLYDNLQKYNLPTPESAFTLEYFRQNPMPFFHLAKEMYRGSSCAPTPTHAFIRLLQDRGLLRRCFTQNVDALERKAGVNPKLIVEAHGSMAEAHCLECRAGHNGDWIKQRILSDRVPARCTQCNRGYVKPDIVFFGEGLPSRFHMLRRVDLPEAGLLIVMGTSLQVEPFCSVVDEVSPMCPRLLINREEVGLRERAGPGLRLNAYDNYRDVALLGSCDEGVRALVSACGWDDDLQMLVNELHDAHQREMYVMAENSSAAVVQSLDDATSDSLQGQLEQTTACSNMNACKRLTEVGAQPEATPEVTASIESRFDHPYMQNQKGCKMRSGPSFDGNCYDTGSPLREGADRHRSFPAVTGRDGQDMLLEMDLHVLATPPTAVREIEALATAQQRACGDEPEVDLPGEVPGPLEPLPPIQALRKCWRRRFNTDLPPLRGLAGLAQRDGVCDAAASKAAVAPELAAVVAKEAAALEAEAADDALRIAFTAPGAKPMVEVVGGTTLDLQVVLGFEAPQDLGRCSLVLVQHGAVHPGRVFDRAELRAQVAPTGVLPAVRLMVPTLCKKQLEDSATISYEVWLVQEHDRSTEDRALARAGPLAVSSNVEGVDRAGQAPRIGTWSHGELVGADEGREKWPEQVRTSRAGRVLIPAAAARSLLGLEPAVPPQLPRPKQRPVIKNGARPSLKNGIGQATRHAESTPARNTGGLLVPSKRKRCGRCRSCANPSWKKRCEGPINGGDVEDDDEDCEGDIAAIDLLVDSVCANRATIGIVQGPMNLKRSPSVRWARGVLHPRRLHSGSGGLLGNDKVGTKGSGTTLRPTPRDPG